MPVGLMMSVMPNLEFQRWIALRILEAEEERDRAAQARVASRLKGR